jgi:hypothetical protein
VLPAERCDVPRQVLVDRAALAPQIVIGHVEIFGVPEDDCRVSGAILE